MKSSALSIGAILIFACLTATPAARADRPQGVDIGRVAKIAADYLATHGKGAPFVVSIALEPDALLGGKSSWMVRFSRPLFADGNTEIGMRVKPDGSVSHLVEEKKAPRKSIAH